jgi:hypothetical protein
MVPAAVVAHLAAAFEQPQPDRHHWEAATLTVHCGGSSSSSSSSVAEPTSDQGCLLPPAADCGIQVARCATAAAEAQSIAE